MSPVRINGCIRDERQKKENRKKIREIKYGKMQESFYEKLADYFEYSMEIDVFSPKRTKEFGKLRPYLCTAFLCIR